MLAPPGAGLVPFHPPCVGVHHRQHVVFAKGNQQIARLEHREGGGERGRQFPDLVDVKKLRVAALARPEAFAGRGQNGFQPAVIEKPHDRMFLDHPAVFRDMLDGVVGKLARWLFQREGRKLVFRGGASRGEIAPTGDPETAPGRAFDGMVAGAMQGPDRIAAARYAHRADIFVVERDRAVRLDHRAVDVDIAIGLRRAIADIIEIGDVTAERHRPVGHHRPVAAHQPDAGLAVEETGQKDKLPVRADLIDRHPRARLAGRADEGFRQVGIQLARQLVQDLLDLGLHGLHRPVGEVLAVGRIDARQEAGTNDKQGGRNPEGPAREGI